ncbi:MAG: glycosyl hydrolase [Lentisphaeria bacterium]
MPPLNRQFLQTFAHPGSEFRGKPFWAWNGPLAPDELRRQIRVMKQMGLGGFFMHSRVGLDTAYLSADWFNCVDACLDEAGKQDMQAWLYDEDRWPSGAAGGLVTQNPQYRMRSLKLHTPASAKGFAWDADTVAVFAARVKDATAAKVRELRKGAKVTLAAGESLLVFKVELNACANWYNGYTYLDTLNHEAVREFIKVTHEAYRKRYGKEFGKRIPGIFTDEPNHGHKIGHDNNTGEPQGMPWTAKLPAVFKKRYGYDLLPHLVELFFDVDGAPVSRARYHYHDCVTFLFVDAFTRQIGEWCGKNGLQFTGHMLEEDTLASQVNVVGDCMRHYEFMQAPGMDLLTEHWRVFNTAKQVSSVAHQFGRARRLTETYGCTGWDFSFAGHKALGDWQVALGINLRCQHLAWYTMLGEAKRDYPAGIFYQSPWWEAYPKVEDYFARILSVMTRGTEVRDLLVLHPVESMWLLCKRGWRQAQAVEDGNEQFIRLTDSLLAGHVDYDFGNEEILSRHGTVAGQGKTAALKVAKAAYKAVLVPPMTTMRRSTLELLQKFQRAGGTVIFAGRPPTHVEAEPTDAVARFAKSCPRTEPEGAKLVAAVEPACRRLSIADDRGREIAQALYLLREDADACYLFVCNTGEAVGRTRIMNQPLVRDRVDAFPEVRIRGLAGCAGTPVELDPQTGAVLATEAVRTPRGWEIRTSLPRLGSRLFVVPQKAAPQAALRKPADAKTVATSTLDPARWEIRLSECNNLVLDRARYRIGNGAWQPAGEILRIDREVRKALGIKHRCGDMVQPWAQPRNPKPKHTTVALEYTFDADALPSGDLFLALERPETFTITVNDTPLSTEAECGWWCDRSLRKLPLNPAVLRTGVNRITMICNYPETHSGLEIVYLLGTFGTRVDDTRVALTAPPATLALGDWTEQGLAFYSGSVSYTTTLKLKKNAGRRVLVQVPEYRGTAVRVLVNGQAAGIIAWEPNEVDVTELLGAGANDLQIEVLGHRRNSHGPFHINEKWPTWNGPGEFTRDTDTWIDGYQLVPCGLMAAPRLVVRQG